MDKESMDRSALVMQKTAELLHAVPAILEERDQLRVKVAKLEQRAYAEKVARKMHEKGIDSDMPLPELVDECVKRAEAGKLTQWEEYVDKTASDMSIRSVKVDDREEVPSGEGMDSFTRYLVG